MCLGENKLQKRTNFHASHIQQTQNKVIFNTLYVLTFGRLTNLRYFCIENPSKVCRFKKILFDFSHRFLLNFFGETFDDHLNYPLMTRFFPLIVTALLMFTACSKQYNIDGNSSLSCLDGQKLYLRVTKFNETQHHTIDLDSCYVVHGRFSFGGSVDSIAMAEVYMGDERLMPIVLEGGELLMQVDNYGQTVTGGPLNERLTEFLRRRSRYDNELWELDRMASKLLYTGKSMPEVIAELEPKRKDLIKKIEDMEVKFVLDNSTNALGPGYFLQMAHQMVFPTMTEPLQRIVDKAPIDFFRSPGVRHFLFLAGYTPPEAPADSPKKSKKRRNRND